MKVDKRLKAIAGVAGSEKAGSPLSSIILKSTADGKVIGFATDGQLAILAECGDEGTERLLIKSAALRNLDFRVGTIEKVDGTPVLLTSGKAGNTITPCESSEAYTVDIDGLFEKHRPTEGYATVSLNTGFLRKIVGIIDDYQGKKKVTEVNRVSMSVLDQDHSVYFSAFTGGEKVLECMLAPLRKQKR